MNVLFGLHLLLDVFLTLSSLLLLSLLPILVEGYWMVVLRWQQRCMAAIIMESDQTHLPLSEHIYLRYNV